MYNTFDYFGYERQVGDWLIPATNISSINFELLLLRLLKNWYMDTDVFFADHVKFANTDTDTDFRLPKLEVRTPLRQPDVCHSLVVYN